MSALNLGWMGENWFQKPQNPLPLLHFKPRQKTHLKQTLNPLNFASIGIQNPFKKPPPPPVEDASDRYQRMLDYYFWECDNLPDYRRSPEVEKILSDGPVFDRKENPTPEEIEENKHLWEQLDSSPVVKFLRQAEAIADKINQIHLARNRKPYRREDEKLWKALPHVPGLDGRPMPRKAIRTDKESDNKFWDFTKEFFFGLWGFKQRPYPPGRPNDVAQAIGYKRLEERYYDCESPQRQWLHAHMFWEE